MKKLFDPDAAKEMKNLGQTGQKWTKNEKNKTDHERALGKTCCS